MLRQAGPAMDLEEISDQGDRELIVAKTDLVPSKLQSFTAKAVCLRG